MLVYAAVRDIAVSAGRSLGESEEADADSITNLRKKMSVDQGYRQK